MKKYSKFNYLYNLPRCWRSDLGRGVCVIVETSVEHSDAPILIGAVRGIVLASRYLIQPCGSGKSRITHLSRVDMRFVNFLYTMYFFITLFISRFTYKTCEITFSST